MSVTISEIGEKRIISEFLMPLFNPKRAKEGVGDDCGMIDIGGNTWLFSTDRVPSDLIAFRLGIIDYKGLGRYLAWLNISDIAACGGQPIGLLLVLGLPGDLPYSSLRTLCKGFGDAAEKYKCQVLGGDISSSVELSISATSIGKVGLGRALTRRGAQSGDRIFTSKAIGLTPAAFAYHLRADKSTVKLTRKEIIHLNGQFTRVLPLVDLGLALADSKMCTSCMDNTDGLGNSLEELAIASKRSFVIQRDRIILPEVVNKVARAVHEDPIKMGFGAGADLSLVGTISGAMSEMDAKKEFGKHLQIIGYVEEGSGVFLEERGSRTPLKFTKWNYFSSDMGLCS